MNYYKLKNELWSCVIKTFVLLEIYTVDQTSYTHASKLNMDQINKLHWT